MKRSDLLLLIYTVSIIIFTYVPVVHIVALSFNDSMSVDYPWRGFTTYWYTGPLKLAERAGFLNDPTIVLTLKNSLLVAGGTALIVVGVTIPASWAMRGTFRGRNMIFYLLMTGMIYPGVTLAIGNMLVFTQWFNIPLSFFTVLFTLTIFTMPFAMFLLMVRFSPLLGRYEEAAWTLGASKLKAFRTIILPLIKVDVITSALFAYTLAFGEGMRTFFVSSVDFPVLSADLNARFRSQPPIPKFYALGTAITLISIVAVLIAGAYMARQGGLRRRAERVARM
jgi:spermidine/putrescine transport system permease protein